jgi:hypothetical protein
MNEKFINTGLLKNAHPLPLRGRCLLRCKPHRSMNIYILLAVRFFARLASEYPVSNSGQAFEQSRNAGFLTTPVLPVFIFKRIRE